MEFDAYVPVAYGLSTMNYIRWLAGYAVLLY